MGKDAPLLRSVGHQRMIDALTPIETDQASELLRPFLHDISDVGMEKAVILAYLIGVRQGRQDMLERAKGKLMEFHKSGTKSALHQIALLVRMHPDTPAIDHIENLLAVCNNNEGKYSPVNE